MSTTDTPRHAKDSATVGARPRHRPSTGTTLRLLARRVHFVAGAVVAPFLLLLCLTGLGYVFSPQIHDGLYHSQLYVHRVDGTPAPVSEQVAAALTAHPEASVRAVVPPAAPDRTTQVVLAVPGLAADGGNAPARTVYVDPYTNYINGELTTVGGRLPANTWLRDLHGNLHLGQAGRLYSELAASWLPVIVLGGVVLWFAPAGRRQRLRDLLVPRARGKAGRMRLRGVKGPLGVWLAAGLLAVSVSGLLMSQFAGGRADPSVNPLDATAPKLAAAPVPVPDRARPIGVDRVLAVAADQELRGELVVTLPREQGEPFTVTERSEGLPVARDAIAVHPFTGAVVERLDWADWPLLARVATLAVEAHTGTLFGPVNQVLLALLAVGTTVVVVLSYLMWWKRSPYRGAWAAMPPPAWRQLPRGVLAAVALATAVLSWLLPVFGVSLVVFVVVDAAIHARRKRRRPIPSPRPR